MADSLRRSEWRSRADDPKGTLGWWWRGVVREAGLFSLPLGAMVLLGVGWATSARWTPLAILAWGLTTIAAKTISKRNASLLPETPEGSFRSGVVYRRSRIALGHDTLALSFVDSWLYAEGPHSTFALRPLDVQEMSGKFDPGCVLVLTDGSQVELTGLEDQERRMLDAWHRSGIVPEGVPTFPPAKVHPQVFASPLSLLALGIMAKLASSFFRPGTGWADGWTRVVLHQGLWFVSLVSILIAGHRLCRLNELKTSKTPEHGEVLDAG